MAMGRRKKRVRQERLWVPTAALPVRASHPFYQRLNQILDEKKFDEYVETICEDFYPGEVGRPGLSPGIYFRLLRFRWSSASGSMVKYACRIEEKRASWIEPRIGTHIGIAV